MAGLSVADVVNVTINLAPLAAQFRNFGSLIILGSSAVVDINERLRLYTQLDGVASDFGTTAPEFLAADLFFSQSPQPALLYIGRWAQSATSGVLNGGVLTPTQQLMSNFTAITTGTMTVSIDGTPHALTAMDFSAQTNLNGVASVVQGKLAGAGTFVWDGDVQRFELTSTTTGVASTVGYATPSGTGTDVSSLLVLTTGNASVPVPGIVAETLLSCVANLANISQDWYGLTVATATPPQIADHMAVAAFIEGTGNSRIYGVTITSTTVLDPTTSADLASQLMQANFKRTFSQYSTSSPYACTSIFGRAFTVDFNGNNTTITLKFKQEPGIVAETISESQAATLNAKNCNVFVNYQNGTAIVQQGVMANGFFFDEVHGTDWFQNRAQTDVYNLLFGSPTKIPQTDAGTHQIVTVLNGSCEAAVNNGLCAPGVWNVAGFGTLNQGDTLTTGYYVYAPLVASQAQADREARKSVPIQIALKLAGAIHFANIAVTVNR